MHKASPKTCEHTPGKLSTDPADRLRSSDEPAWWPQAVRDADKNIIASVFADHRDPDLSRRDARRLVACWNACLRVPTAALESGAVEDLVSACESLLGATEGPAPESFHLDNARHLVAEALRRVKGGA